MSLRAIVFDFDGVIANSEPLHFQAFRDVLADQDIVLTEAQYYERYLGYDDVGVFRTLGLDRAQPWTARRINDFVARKAVRLEALERHTSVLFPGAADAVRRAAAAVPIAIASGALGAEIRRVLTREDLITCFSAIVAAEDTSASKPSADPYLRAIALLTVPAGGRLLPAQCVAIEDSHWGLQSARAAGLRTVVVTNTYASAELSSADLVIDSLSELDLERLRGLCLR